MLCTCNAENLIIKCSIIIMHYQYIKVDKINIKSLWNVLLKMYALIKVNKYPYFVHIFLFISSHFCTSQMNSPLSCVGLSGVKMRFEKMKYPPFLLWWTFKSFNFFFYVYNAHWNRIANTIIPDTNWGLFRADTSENKYLFSKIIIYRTTCPFGDSHRVTYSRDVWVSKKCEYFK